MPWNAFPYQPKISKLGNLDAYDLPGVPSRMQQGSERAAPEMMGNFGGEYDVAENKTLTGRPVIL